MLVPVKWLYDYVDVDIDIKAFSHKMTMSGTKVESVSTRGEGIEGVVAGRVLSIDKHPEADRLWVALVDVGLSAEGRAGGGTFGGSVTDVRAGVDEGAGAGVGDGVGINVGDHVSVDKGFPGALQIITGADNVTRGDIVPIALDGSKLPGGVRIRKSKMRGIDSWGMMCSIQELGLSKEDIPSAPEDGILILDKNVSPGADIRDVLGINEAIIEFELTSNRQDCLGILGIAREAAAVLLKKVKMPPTSIEEEGAPIGGAINIEIEAPDLCSRYTARVVTDVKIAESPEWMKTRLISAGVRPINNIVDITNFVMLETGQPMHAFDMRFINDRKITVRRAKSGELIETLDGTGRTLDKDMLVIADGKKPVAVAGVMGGANSEILDDTTEILFESANFNGVSVRNTSRKLGLRTESSGRFEKGLNPEITMFAVNRAAALTEMLGAGKVMKGVEDCYPVKPAPMTVPFNTDKVNRLLGTNLSAEYMLSILDRLGFEYDSDNNALMAPAFRQDIEMEADIAEEVARFYDYNNIKPTLNPGTEMTLGILTQKQKLKAIVNDVMLSCGLSEIYTLSFHSPKVFDILKIPDDDPVRNAVKLQNPLSEDYSLMRTTTLYDMLKVIASNHSKRAASVSLYEISYTYHLQDGAEERSIGAEAKLNDAGKGSNGAGKGSNGPGKSSIGAEERSIGAEAKLDDAGKGSNSAGAGSNCVCVGSGVAEAKLDGAGAGSDIAGANLDGAGAGAIGAGAGSDIAAIELPVQKDVLTIGMYGKGIDFYSLKGVVEDLIDKLGVKCAIFAPLTDVPQFHPGKTAGIMIGEKKVGFIGEVHPDICKSMELPDKTYVGVIELECLYNASDLEREYSKLPRYPAAQRDIAIIVDKAVPSADIIQLMKSVDELLENVEIFDIYIGRQIPEGKKSLAYSLSFRSDKETLTDEKVNELTAKLLEELRMRFGAELRS